MSFVKSYVNADGRSSRRRIFILSISVILLTALIAGLVIAGVLVHPSRSGKAHASTTSTADAIRSICSVTQYPESCFSALNSAESTDPEELFRYSLTAAIAAVESIINFPESYAKKAGDGMTKEALEICGDLIRDAVDSLNDTISATRNSSGRSYIDDLMTWLSTSLTNFDTCLEALDEAGAGFAAEIELLMRNSTELASNSLAIVAKLLAVVRDLEVPFHRRLLAADEFPAWLPDADRRILTGAAPKPNLIVAKDNTGNYKTINEAVSHIPNKSNHRFVIYVKNGIYKENVLLGKNHLNVMMYGDTGGNPTVITGDTNMVEGTPTFRTATFGVKGPGFMAKYIVFQNTAGAAKHQAVAMRSQSDLSVFYRCTFDGFQDTLYPHSGRQFYRECDITGTIDFIFGNAAVVIQNCNIMPRTPLPNQFLTITAQGRKDGNMNTGTSIQGCLMKLLNGTMLSKSTKTYLGRPWKTYSRTVVMNTEIGRFLDPTGWTPWSANVTPDKVFYGEYMNTGLGANISGRVDWCKPNLTTFDALKYTVGKFINGQEWLGNTGVPFNATLSN